MTDRPGASAWLPAGGGIPGLRAAALACRGCELHEPATQTVFSKGTPLARVAFVGEQPGDREDRQGAPFVGPAGQLLDQALAEAGIDPADAYVTNAVKHFRFTSTPKRRLHQTPEPVHIEACRPWLAAELAVLDPQLIVCLGATAARAIVGPHARVTRDRGKLFPRYGTTTEPTARRSGWTMITVHPSAILRADNKEAAYSAFLADLRIAASVLVDGATS